MRISIMFFNQTACIDIAVCKNCIYEKVEIYVYNLPVIFMRNLLNKRSYIF